jgi:glucose-1-phosphate cytidylyltransferase
MIATPPAPKVVILCGGMGTRLREETDVRPKPMVEIGERPILWHIMKHYAHCGFNDFILCLGYKGDVIKRFFAQYDLLLNDFTVTLGASGRSIEIHHAQQHDWRVTLCDTGAAAKTGARVKRIEKYVDSDLFLLTYGDGVTDLDIATLVAFHRAHGKIGTVTGVVPPSRYGELHIQGKRVMAFAEKPLNEEASINGGYFVFDRRFFDYLSDDEECILEREPLERLARDGQLMVHLHRGFWQCMDTYRDYEFLKGLWERGQAPWKVWK